MRISEWKRDFPGLDSHSDEWTLFLDALEDLQNRGVISVKWVRYRKGEEPESIYLEDDTMLFRLLGIPHPDNTLDAMIQAVQGNGIHSPLSLKIIGFCESFRRGNKDLPMNKPEDLSDLITLFDLPEKGRLSLPLRALSVKLFSNSKRIEELIPLLQFILKRVDDPGEYSSLTRSYPECAIKGRLRLTFDDAREWVLSDEAVSLSLESALHVRLIDPVTRGMYDC